MTKKADFNAEEWATVVQGPLMAGVRVMAAERGGVLRESLSVGQAYSELRREQGASELLDEIVSSPPSLDPQAMGSGADVASRSLERVREAVALVERKATPEEAQAYKAFIRDLAQRVASAKREGGFLGIGGKPVSESEQAALDELAPVLNGGAA